VPSRLFSFCRTTPSSTSIGEAPGYTRFYNNKLNSCLREKCDVRLDAAISPKDK